MNYKEKLIDLCRYIIKKCHSSNLKRSSFENQEKFNIYLRAARTSKKNGRNIEDLAA